MEGDGPRRVCPHCARAVFDLTSLSDADVLALLEQRSRRVEQLFRRADGTAMLGDCPAGVRMRRRRSVSLFLTMAAILLAGLVGRWLSSDSAMGQTLDRFAERWLAADEPTALPVIDYTIEGDEFDSSKDEHFTEGGLGD